MKTTLSRKFFGVYDGIIVIVLLPKPMDGRQASRLCKEAGVPYLQKCFLQNEKIAELNLKQMYFYEYVDAVIKTAPRGYSEG